MRKTSRPAEQTSAINEEDGNSTDFLIDDSGPSSTITNSAFPDISSISCQSSVEVITMENEYDKIRQKISNISSDCLKKCLVDESKLQKVIDNFNCEKIPSKFYTFFIVDTTLIHYFLRALPNDKNKKFELFKAWCFGIFFVGKGSGNRYLDCLAAGVSSFIVSVSCVSALTA